MPWSGGTFSRVHDWTTDAGGAIDIEAVRMDAEDDNFNDGINDCLHKSGQNTAAGNLPMGGNRHTAVGNAAAVDDYASATDVIAQNLAYYVDSGAADVYVITPAPAITAYVEGQRFVFRSGATNTGSATLNVNALGAKNIITNDGSDVAAGVIVTGGYYEVMYDATGPTRFVLMSPSSITGADSATDMIAGTGMTGGGDLSADRTFNVIGGNGITANADDIALTDAAASATNPIDVTSGVFSLDINGLTTIEGNAINAGDTFIVSDGAVDKGVRHDQMGFKVQLGATTQTLATADMNTIMEFNGTATLTLPLNSSVALPVGSAVIVVVDHATQVVTVDAAASVTLNSKFHPGGTASASDRVIAGGMAVVIKTATNDWYISGDIAD